MRAVWLSAAALLLLAVTSALGATQVERATRIGRRLPSTTAPEANSPVDGTQRSEAQPTFRSRNSRRREEVTPTPQRVVRNRQRGKPTEVLETSSEGPQSPTGPHERFQSRKTPIRSRGNTIKTETSTTTPSRSNVIRSRSRQNIRRPSSTNPPPPEVTSPAIDESKIEVINSDLESLAKATPTDEKIDVNSQFRRRSSTVQTTERVDPQKIRGRVNRRPTARSLDLEISGTSNTLTKSDKEPPTTSNEDLRNSRKLRYKSRTSETDTNLTGEGLKTQNEATVSSQNEENFTSQPKIESSAPGIVDNSIQQSTETSPAKTTTQKITKVVRRPLSRGTAGFKPKNSVSAPKVEKVSDEISEDDNYPESFKALIQAKSASTQTNSTPRESFLVKASQKVYKTYTASSQSTNTGPAINKYTRLRSKQILEKKENNEDDNKNEENATDPSASTSPKEKLPEFRPRGTYTPRSRKPQTISSSSTSTPSSSSISEKTAYKYNRKFKITTSEPPRLVTASKRAEINGSQKKTFTRSSYYQRKNTVTANINTDTPSERNISGNSSKVKSVLPRTSYYSRLRSNKTGSSTTSTESSTELVTNEDIAEKKNADTADMPLIFTLLKNPINMETSSEKVLMLDSDKNQDKKMFIIAVTSKESQEMNSINEVTDAAERSENKLDYNSIPTTMKYHSNYKDVSSTIKPNSVENVVSSTIVPVRNILTRKYGRKYTKVGQYENIDVTTPKVREKGFRKFSESFSKTTEASSNRINSEPEKVRTRFSSKYRASNIDKPIYTPTVPTVTSSTAWLKFFVTDQLLTKSLEEPSWFDEDDYSDVKTESMSRHTTASPFIHESSIELVEGEEIDLGSDMNEISITKTRSTLSSADLRLSESPMKPSHIMNVEASHHSPSVTVSIFDALAEILTSTPRIRLSSTTEVTQKPNTNIDVIQTFNGVSNLNVNSVGNSQSKDTMISTTSVTNTNAKTVQITDQTTPIVINHLFVGKGVTPSLNEEEKVDTVSTLKSNPTPTPLPTTPVSARKPFAIKFLYADTESTLDNHLTTTTSSNQPTTDSTTVYNSVSDLLLSNNKVVSSELTSMLTNNIEKIIKNMDENSRSRITLDMAELLKTLIPRAIDGLVTVGNDVDVDFVPSTTPYSLEDIVDTENIDINDRKSNENLNISILQNAPNDTVNNTVNSEVISFVNISSVTPSTLSVSPSQGISVTSTNVNLSTAESIDDKSSAILNEKSIKKLNTDIVIESRQSTITNNAPKIDIPDNTIPFPFLTNYGAEDFNFSEMVNAENNNNRVMAQSLTLKTAPNNPPTDIYNLNTNDPNQVSKFQLWVLSKKARVLKMIEELLRQHNEELATAQPLTEIISQSNNGPLSERLTKIITNMGLTTETSFIQNDVTSTSISSNFTPTSTSTERFTPNFENSGDNSEKYATIETSTPTIEISSKNQQFDLSLRFDSNESDITKGTTETAPTESSAMTTEAAKSFEENQVNMIVTTDTILELSSQNNTETTTAPILTETTTQTNTDFTTVGDTETVTETVPVSESTTVSDDVNVNQTTQNISLSVSTESINSKPTIPKKDFVIFGILPNNTVVRKNPNDDILETLTEASPYIVYGVLPNNTIIRKFPNGTRVPRVMQKIDVLPISPWSLRNPYSPIHNNPAIVRPQSNPIQVSTNISTSTDSSNNGTESRLTIDTVNNPQTMISPSPLNLKDSRSLGITTTNKPAEKSTASHVLSLRTTTMLPSLDEILLNSISSAAKQEMVISSMTSSTSEPRILTLDIDPETKQIRTEKPGDGDGNAVFKFIPIDEVTIAPQNTNVQKLASTKTPSNTEKVEIQTVKSNTATEMNTHTPQIQSRLQNTDDTPSTTPFVTAVNTMTETITVPDTTIITTESIEMITQNPSIGTVPTVSETITTLAATTTTALPQATLPPTITSTTTTMAPTTTLAPITTTTATTVTSPFTTQESTTIPTIQTTTLPSSTVTSTTVVTAAEDIQYQNDAQILQQLLLGTLDRNPKNLKLPPADSSSLYTTTDQTTTIDYPRTTENLDEAKLLQALLGVNGQTYNTLNINSRFKDTSTVKTTTSRSIEDDIRQFEDDTKLLKALLQATGQNPDNFNIPTLNFKTTPTPAVETTTERASTTTILTTTTTQNPATSTKPPTTVQSVDDEIKKLQEDAKLLQELLQATGKNTNNLNLPIVSGITSSVRISSNQNTMPINRNPATTNFGPVYTKTTTPVSPVFTFTPRSTIQTSTEDIGVSTTFIPFNQGGRLSTTTERNIESTTYLTGRRAPITRVTSTTDLPSTSTFSVEEDLAFLTNLKTVLKNNPNNEDPESSLANRIIALAVERSLNEIQSNSDRGGKAISSSSFNVIPTTTRPFTTTRTTTTTTTTTPRPTTTTQRPTTTTQLPFTTTSLPTTITTDKSSTPSLEDDIKQFEEDTKLLQALLKATGQDPTKFNIPTLPPLTTTNTKVSSESFSDSKLLTNINLPLTKSELYHKKLTDMNVPTTTTTDRTMTARPFAVKDDLKTIQDDEKLLKTLVKLQDAQEMTTQRNKLTITGQTSDVALKNLLKSQQLAKPGGMMSQATHTPMSLSTEYGKSNDALLAALLKEQGFGPTTASSLDEQLRLSALLNQVVVTPKARMTTPPPPPPPPPRRPILDGLAWLWQQWRETAPGPSPRPNRKPNPSASPSVATSQRVNWFGSGPFVGNADNQPSANRVPLDPPRAVMAQQTPGRGQLVSAAINVTRAFSQFLGAAIQGAAQTVQNVIRAGQKAATDVYISGSGGSG